MGPETFTILFDCAEAPAAKRNVTAANTPVLFNHIRTFMELAPCEAGGVVELRGGGRAHPEVTRCPGKPNRASERFPVLDREDQFHKYTPTSVGVVVHCRLRPSPRSDVFLYLVWTLSNMATKLSIRS